MALLEAARVTAERRLVWTGWFHCWGGGQTWDEFFEDVKHFCQDYSIYTYIRYCIYIYIIIYYIWLHITHVLCDHYDFYTSYTVYTCIYYSLATREGRGSVQSPRKCMFLVSKFKIEPPKKSSYFPHDFLCYCNIIGNHRSYSVGRIEIKQITIVQAIFLAGRNSGAIDSP